MHTRREMLTGTAVAVLGLAVPGAALAASAGDDQYADPFAGVTPHRRKRRRHKKRHKRRHRKHRS